MKAPSIKTEAQFDSLVATGMLAEFHPDAPWSWAEFQKWQVDENYPPLGGYTVEEIAMNKEDFDNLYSHIEKDWWGPTPNKDGIRPIPRPSWAIEPPGIPVTKTDKLSGGSSDYYLVEINNPTRAGLPEYIAECNDIIKVLEMSYAVANIFKAIWRRGKCKLGEGKEGNTTRRDAEKVFFFAFDVLEEEGLGREEIAELIKQRGY